MQPGTSLGGFGVFLSPSFLRFVSLFAWFGLVLFCCSADLIVCGLLCWALRDIAVAQGSEIPPSIGLFWLVCMSVYRGGGGDWQERRKGEGSQNLGKVLLGGFNSGFFLFCFVLVMILRKRFAESRGAHTRAAASHRIASHCIIDHSGTRQGWDECEIR